MGANIMAIYDLDGIYAERFMEYINRSTHTR